MKTNGKEMTGYISVVEVPALKFWKRMADRRLDLLVECAQLLSFKVIDEIAAGDLIEKIEEEIGSKIDLS